MKSVTRTWLKGDVLNHLQRMEGITAAAIACGVGAATTKTLGFVLQAKAVPVLMAATGKVVSGVVKCSDSGTLEG